MVDVTLEPVRAQGRAKEALEVTVVRALAPADIALANAPGRGSLSTAHPTVARLRESHHAIARLLATGMPATEVAIITGYTEARISVLRADPAFAALVEFYRKNLDLAQIDVQGRLATLNADMIQELQDRLDNEPERFSDGFVLKSIEVLSDRTGNGPTSRNVNVNFNVGMADRLKEARQRAIEASRPKEEAA